LRNAIPRESVAVFALSVAHQPAVQAAFEHCNEIIKKEYAFTDPNLTIALVELPNVQQEALSQQDTLGVLHGINACPNGIIRLTPELLSAVQTSTNIARVTLESGEFEVLILSRSSVDSEKMEVTKSIEGAFYGISAEVTHSGSYPGWTPAPKSAIVTIMHELYKELYKEEPKVMACHAGLECGILGQNYPKVDMISFGPNIRGAHSPDERVQISSVQRYWDYLLKTLERIPAKA
jgi:dipeptidase D